MVDMLKTIEPKTDQLNADSLIGGPITVTIIGVRGNDGAPDQPVSISYQGDDGKPYKPCKSMRRVMVQVWGADAKQYVGRSMTLYCDPEVQFGGMKVGGIRISHMSHIDKPVTMALTATKSKRKPFTVQPLKAAPAPQPPPKEPEVTPEDKAAYLRLLTSAPNLSALQDTFKRAWRWAENTDPVDADAQKEFKTLYDKRKETLT